MARSCKTTIDRLPNYLVESQIFSLIAPESRLLLRLVCHRWSQLVSFNDRSFVCSNPPKAKYFLPKFGLSLRQLRIKGGAWCGKRFEAQMLVDCGCFNLAWLDCGSVVEGESIVLVTRGIEKLTKLIKLIVGSVESSPADWRSEENFWNHQLLHFEMLEVPQINESFLQKLKSRGLVKLKTLNFGWCLSDSDVANMISKSPQRLQELSIHSTKLIEASCLCEAKLLKILNLNFCENFDNWATVLNSLINLTELHACFTRISWEDIAHIPSRTPLSSISLSGTKAVCVESFAILCYRRFPLAHVEAEDHVPAVHKMISLPETDRMEWQNRSQLDEEAVSRLLIAFSGTLKSLLITGCQLVGDGIFGTLLDFGGGLSQVSLSGTDCTKHGLVTFIENRAGDKRCGLALDKETDLELLHLRWHDRFILRQLDLKMMNDAKVVL